MNYKAEKVVIVLTISLMAYGAIAYHKDEDPHIHPTTYTTMTANINTSGVTASQTTTTTTTLPGDIAQN